ncbi:cAMP-specific 3',5'-cyclic phosphodiesterase 7B [Chionoecetes opilio]|uniref:Phosphodiesterase n=1 Tax=Chionoecetes opilio TaxID=41210 RepID=A0A8J4YJR8_CHIOP|nr:cAMP-specific 3',5'-cyclic phosphodiesterase 7B [Chionoecetes opilio]
MNYNLGEMNVGDAELRLLGGAGRCPYYRFMTLHRRRRQKQPTRLLEKQHQALLDDLYNGLTQNMLSQVGGWCFNAFALNSVCGGRPVSVLCVYLMHQYGLIHHYKFDTVTVWKCFSLIEDGYHASNPYHNAIHAADVTQAMHCYLQEQKIQQHLTPLELLAALIAAVCHDLDHPGVNQPFLIATDNHLAALYKNFSVLENHHWRCAMGCLWESGLLDTWASDDVASLQDMLRSLILATDITRQQEFLARFRICDEFYRQGDYERQLNLPVTVLCDSKKMSVARIQTDFINFVVSPLFDVWDRWLKTSLSNSMVVNLNTNLKKWEAKLVKKSSEDVTAQPPVVPPDSPAVESTQEDAEEVDGGTSPSSSGDSHQSVLGSLENVSRSLQLGRRHSMPLNMPRFLPRTIIRRESLPEDGNEAVVIETVTMAGMSFTSLSSQAPELSSTLTPDALLPEPSITAMGGVGIGSSRPISRLIRRKSLPPLWLKQTRTRTSHMLPPLSPTPSEDTPSHQATQENSPEDSDNIQRLGAVGSVSSAHSSGKNGSDCSGPGGCDQHESCGDSLDPVEQVHHPLRSDKLTSTQGLGVHNRKSFSSHQSAATFLHSEILDNHPYRPFIGKGLVRRASLDSTSINSKREFLDRLLHESNKFPRVDRTNSELDKENLVPRETSSYRERQQQIHLWKTRAWHSLNCDDEKVCDAREKLIKPGIYRLNHSQGNLHAHGRRGSAPLLRPEELSGGLRGGAERPDYRYLSLRRGSAPSQANQKGNHTVFHLEKLKDLTCAHEYAVAVSNRFDVLGALEDPVELWDTFKRETLQAAKECCDSEVGPGAACHHTPLTSTENLQPFGEFITGHSRLRGQRRGSVPFDHPGLCQHGSGGVEVPPSRTGKGGSFGIPGGGCGTAGFPTVLPLYYPEYHRGSGGLELLTGLWR